MIRNVQAATNYGISFEVEDNGGTIACYVTRAALQERAARDNLQTADLRTIFNSYRLEIDLAASKKWRMEAAEDPIIIDHLPNR